MSGLRWWKLRTRTVIMTEMVHMIMTAAKYTPTTTTRTVIMTEMVHMIITAAKYTPTTTTRTVVGKQCT